MSLFKKVLIANRGEIALRVIRACRELGIRTAIVYSDVDKNTLPVRLADEAICIGPAKSAQSYLNIPAIITAAEITNAEAIHPGYGFLAENPQFVEACVASNITFIGPPVECIRNGGDKSKAREIMEKHGVPVVPGSETPITNDKEAMKIAKKIKFPVILKASAGGGGKGMRIVEKQEDLVNLYHTAQKEALAAFGNGEMYIEKYISDMRHIEVQIISDNEGNTIHLGERDCSIQRRHQKLIEEAPFILADAEFRNKIGALAIKAAKAMNYVNVGTIEFILDNEGNLYFMEINTRVQVEHPITEMITGIDIVKEQIKIAAGQTMTLKQDEITFSGHSIECRINAEDPETFIPSPGTISLFIPPGGQGVRVDTAAFTGWNVPIFYDSLIAKLIVHGSDRDDAINIMKRALHEFVIEGIKTTIPFYMKLLNDPVFLSGKFNTHFIENSKKFK
ncbi:biotin carboxylase [bacterium BMS3Bbin09]|nr:biotin carboxylase [bacterium BMS3Bbin09]HDH34373.1 acetyl-CoA carboxylase biotin carboxylase subunit [Nitrospirota bacterium]